MSNPFADPSHSSDPFDDPTIESGAHALHDVRVSLSTDSLDDQLQKTPTISSMGGGGRSDDTAARLDEIRRREQALENRERTIGQREERVRRFGRNNWPNFYPLIYHDISVEIPQESQIVVLTLYRIWLLLLLTLILNLVGCVFLLISGQPDGAKDLGAGIMYLPVISVLSFLLWYRPIYNAFMKEHALFYYLFFVFGGFHLAFSIYMLIGIPSTGSAGLINMIHAFGTGSIVTGIFGVLATVGWALESAGMLFEYRAIWKHHNDKGHSFEQAKAEMATHGFKAYFTRGSQV